jgi:hypothetical protein
VAEVVVSAFAETELIEECGELLASRLAFFASFCFFLGHSLFLAFLVAVRRAVCPPGATR